MDLSFLETKGTAVDHEVCGKSFKFYAATVQGAYLLKNLGRPVLQALGAIFGGIGAETGLTERSMTKPGGEFVTSTEVTAISPELAKLRIETRDKSIATLVDTLLEQKNGIVMAEIVADSLQDDWPRDAHGRFDQKALAAFWNKMTVQAAVAFLSGVAKANRPVFDPLVERLRGNLPGQGSSRSPSGPAATAQAASPVLEPTPSVST